MKPVCTILLGLFFAFQVTAQNEELAIKENPPSLEDRYKVMKSNSQTYQEYKVIKESVLEEFWKIVMDSLSRKEGKNKELTLTKATLEKDLGIAKAELKHKEDSMSDIVFASTHITLGGRSLTKNLFLTVMAFVVFSLLAVITFQMSRIKTMKLFVAESQLIIDGITSEFDLYKRKSLEKQIKLSRELQTERNKVNELMVIPKLSK